ATMAAYESKKRSLDLKELCSDAVLKRQMEKQVAMNDIRVGFALAAPNPCNGNAAAMEDLAQALANFREAGAIRVIKGDRSRPVNGEMGNQRKADRFCKFDCFNNVCRLRN